jgi:hypothetical protein
VAVHSFSTAVTTKLHNFTTPGICSLNFHSCGSLTCQKTVCSQLEFITHISSEYDRLIAAMLVFSMDKFRLVSALKCFWCWSSRNNSESFLCLINSYMYIQCGCEQLLWRFGGPWCLHLYCGSMCSKNMYAYRFRSTDIWENDGVDTRCVRTGTVER